MGAVELLRNEFRAPSEAPPERGVPTPPQVGRTQDAASGETALLGDFEDVECLPDAADLEVRAPAGASNGSLALGEGGLGVGEVG